MTPNTTASLFVIGYLVAVLVAGNEKALTKQLLSETEFVKWLSALSIVMSASQWLGNAGRVYIVMIYIAMALQAVRQSPDVFDKLSGLLTAKKLR